MVSNREIQPISYSKLNTFPQFNHVIWRNCIKENILLFFSLDKKKIRARDRLFIICHTRNRYVKSKIKRHIKLIHENFTEPPTKFATLILKGYRKEKGIRPIPWGFWTEHISGKIRPSCRREWRSRRLAEEDWVVSSENSTYVWTER